MIGRRMLGLLLAAGCGSPHPQSPPTDGSDADVDGSVDAFIPDAYQGSDLDDKVHALALNGYSLDHTNANPSKDLVSFGHDASLSATTAFSFTIWVKPYDLFDFQTIAAQWGWGTATGRWVLRTSGNSGKDQLVFNLSPNGTDFANDFVFGSVTALTVDTWVHIAVVYDGSAATDLERVRLYVNGVLDAGTVKTGSIPTSLLASTSDLELGRWSGQAATSSEPLRGALRDARFFSRALSDQEVTTVFGGDTVTAGLVSAWPLDGDLTDTVGPNSGVSSPPAPDGPVFVLRDPFIHPGFGPRVMAIGDSNTSGFGFPGGWRRELFSEMAVTYGKPIDLVGSLLNTGVPDYFIDTNHEGVFGQTCAQIQTRVAQDIGMNPADAFIVMCGTNDVCADALPATQARDNLSSLVEAIYAQPGVTNTTPVVIATIPPMGGTCATADTSRAAFNALLPALAASLRTEGKSVTLADPASRVVNPYDFQSDEIHLSRPGHEKYATILAAVLASALP